jgi:hypothetical protein
MGLKVKELNNILSLRFVRCGWSGGRAAMDRVSVMEFHRHRPHFTLRIATSGCNVETDWLRDARDMDAYRERNVAEYGFVPHTSFCLCVPLATTRKVDFEILNDNNRIVSAVRDTAGHALRRYFGRAAITDSELDRFYALTNCAMRVANRCPVAPEDAMMHDFLEFWKRPGRTESEECLEVGLATSLLYVLGKEREVRLLWWERETRVADEKMLRDLMRRLREAMALFGVGDYIDILAETARIWMEWTIDVFAKVNTVSIDKNVHLYENPRWEQFWVNYGRAEICREILEKNHHPRSGHWMGGGSVFVIPQRRD